MKKNIFSMILALVIPFCVTEAYAGIFVYDFDEFAQIPILDQGRVKPLETFARTYLEGFYGRESLKEMDAIEWMAELLFNSERAFKRHVFNIPNPKIVDALELERRKKHKYSYNEVSTAMQANFKTWHSLFMKPEDDLTSDQKQLLMLYRKVQLYSKISRSFSLLFMDFKIPSGQLADELGVQPGTALSYIDVRRKQKIIQQMSADIRKKRSEKTESMTAQDLQLTKIARKMAEFDRDKSNQILRIVPPQWEGNGSPWFSPWGVSLQGHGSPQTAQFLRLWQRLMQAYQKGNNDKWVATVVEIRAASLDMAKGEVSENVLTMEYFFNRFKPFTKSLMCYLLAFLTILIGYLFWANKMRIVSFVFLMLGFFIHTSGILMRMIIMKRPPVTNLYASIIFVGFICVLFGIFLEIRRKNGLGILIGASVGTILQFMGLRYDADGDTMGMLQAVLDTNFWLSTHVVTITIGYGCCLVGGVIAHIYLLQRIIKPNDQQKPKELMSNIKGVCIVAIFFTALGTILGGIWADQSWGRFWGWDPKENGALLIVLWLVFLVHGRLCGKLGELGFVAGMVLTNIVVALAWFGVNLLNVGLHSYGFTDSAAFNLITFCTVELLFAAGGYWAIRLRQQKVLQ